MEQPIIPNHLDADALYQLGIAYILDENGHKKPDADFASAIPYLQQAAELGHAEAQATLGACYANGFGVACNYEQAHHWFAKAAEQGNATATYYLEKCDFNPPPPPEPKEEKQEKPSEP